MAEQSRIESENLELREQEYQRRVMLGKQRAETDAGKQATKLRAEVARLTKELEAAKADPSFQELDRLRNENTQLSLKSWKADWEQDDLRKRLAKAEERNSAMQVRLAELDKPVPSQPTIPPTPVSTTPAMSEERRRELDAEFADCIAAGMSSAKARCKEIIAELERA